MSTTEQEVARLLEVREKEEEIDGTENAVEENINEEPSEEIPDHIDVMLDEVDKLQLELISVKQALLEEQRKTIEIELARIVENIKTKNEAPANYTFRFDPRNPYFVRLEKPKGGRQ